MQVPSLTTPDTQNNLFFVHCYLTLVSIALTKYRSVVSSQAIFFSQD